MENQKYKHLTPEAREEIQSCLDHGMSFKEIGKRIGKDQTTISKEVKKHIIYHSNSFVKTEECCPLLLKSPFVCNGCKKRSLSSCSYTRRLYRAANAQTEYRTALVESREGIPLNKESFYETEKIISDAVQKGQHIYHILQTHALPVSKATVYRHINKQYYAIGRIDLPRAVKFKPRRSKCSEFVPKCIRKDRSYEEFLEFKEQNPHLSHTEIDTVIGRIGGKTILTIHFTAFNFMVGLLLEDKTAVEVSSKIKSLKQILNDKGFSFGKLMPVILTDNGGEFSNVQCVECNSDGEKESSVFFCHPGAPSEKPQIEKNHTIFRDIVPKCSSFDHFTQDTVNHIFSHVNAVKREIFNGKSPYDLFCFAYSSELAEALGISFIRPEDVIQSPKLLK